MGEMKSKSLSAEAEISKNSRDGCGESARAFISITMDYLKSKGLGNGKLVESKIDGAGKSGNYIFQQGCRCKAKNRNRSRG